MTGPRAEEILRILRKTFPTRRKIPIKDDPFPTLIRTIISQNTAAGNTAKAFENLSKRFEIKPEVLANVETRQIEECLKVAGLYRRRAIVIKQLSQTILDKFQGNVEQILSMPFEASRKTFLQLPGVGPKTADIMLLFCSGAPTMPVDTHVNRVSKRLALAPPKSSYETTRRSIQSHYDPKNYLEVHLLLISLGREYCKARVPLCEQCPLNLLCPSKQLWDNC